MIWHWLIASVLGFLAVLPLAHYLPDLPTNTSIWQICTLICMAMVGLNGLIYFLLKKRFHPSPSKISAHFLSTLFASVNFFGVLLASVNYGLAHYFSCQHSLVSEPITVTATIRSPQISDTINLSDNTARDKTLIGTGYQRQVWQIIEIKPFADDSFTTNNTANNAALNDIEDGQNFSENFNQKLPLTVLATANLNKNPDWLPILNSLQPNQTLSVKIALEPITQSKPIDNPNFKQISLGFNEVLWLRQRDIQAKAQVLDIYPKKSPVLADRNDSFLQKCQLFAEQIRWQLRQKLLIFLQSQSPTSPEKSTATVQSTAILLSLLTGDSGLLSPDTKHLYQVTGISHLLAISGPHVMMLASVVAFLLVAVVKLFFPKLLFRLPAQLLLLWTSVAVSLMYALLVGFELPAQRTVWMLLLVTASVQWLLPISSYRVLAWVGLAMVWLDTTAVMQAGFWLSFVAVGLLLKFSQTLTIQAVDIQTAGTQMASEEISLFQNSLSKIWQEFKQLILLQLWLFVLMMPVVVWFFGKISLVSIAVNLLAVPFLGLVIVPLDMLAGVLSFFPVIGTTLSEMIWQSLTSSLSIFHQVLQKIAAIGFAKQVYIGLSNVQLLLLGMAGVLLLLPKRLIPKLLTLPVLLAVFAISYQAKHTVQTPQLIVLDDTRLSVNLWVNGDKSWLILADNRFTKTDKNSSEVKTSQTANKLETDILENKIYPLLAKYNITQLAGVISQTPSGQANDFVQQLAKSVPVQTYWLAGFNPLDKASEQNFNGITPQICQVGKKSEAGDVEAITGWQLDANQLGKPLDDKETWQTQTCFIQVKSPQKSAILMAGDSDVPMQMSQLLCKTSPVDVLISPAVTPFSQDWLADTQPSQIHLITSRYSTPAEDSQFVIAGYIEDSDSQHHKVTQVQSSEVGTVAYGF